MKKVLKSIKGSTLFEVIGGMALLLVFSTMLYSGIVLGGKFMSGGNDVQNASNQHQTSIEMYNYYASKASPSADAYRSANVTNKTVGIKIGATNITIPGKIYVYQDANDEEGASTLAEFVAD